jgi:type IV secretory pathway VirB4 component
VRPMAFALDQLCTGNLRGMFDGPTTPGLDLDAPLVILNLRQVLNTHVAALGILMTCATAWLQAMIEAETDAEGAKRIVVIDEGWRILSNLGIGEWLQQSFKLSRALGTQNIVVLHRLSDQHTAGAEGSRELRLAEGLLADAETKVIYAQPPDQVPKTREILGLTDTEAELLPHLRRGWALWKVGDRSFLIQHRLSTVERELVNTDARMLARTET